MAEDARELGIEEYYEPVVEYYMETDADGDYIVGTDGGVHQIGEDGALTKVEGEKASTIFGKSQLDDDHVEVALSSDTKSTAADLMRAYPEIDKDLADEIVLVSDKHNFEDPAHLAHLINFETGGTFKSGETNTDSGATGLIQFIPSTMVEMGLTAEQLAALTPAEQMEYVDAYFNLPRVKDSLKQRADPAAPVSQEDVAMMVFQPAAVGQPDHVFSAKEQALNKGIKAPADYMKLMQARLTAVTPTGGDWSDITAEDIASGQIDLGRLQVEGHVAEGGDLAAHKQKFQQLREAETPKGEVVTKGTGIPTKDTEMIAGIPFGVLDQEGAQDKLPEDPPEDNPPLTDEVAEIVAESPGTEVAPGHVFLEGQPKTTPGALAPVADARQREGVAKMLAAEQAKLAVEQQKTRREALKTLGMTVTAATEKQQRKDQRRRDQAMKQAVKQANKPDPTMAVGLAAMAAQKEADALAKKRASQTAEQGDTPIGDDGLPQVTTPGSGGLR